jgi:hypothetical protein
MGKLVKAARIAVAVAAWLATHTSFATETITATGGNAGAVAGAVAGSSSGATSGATGGNPSANVSGGNTRAYGLGLGAAVSPATCYGTILGGGGVTTQDDCLRFQWHQRMLAQADATGSTEMYRAARLFLCVNDEAAHAMKHAGLDCPKPAGPRGPVFQTGAEGASGYDAYRPYQN